MLGSADTLMIASRDGGVTVDGATVVKTDIAATNGVIHVIGSVILPKENNLTHLPFRERELRASHPLPWADPCFESRPSFPPLMRRPELLCVLGCLWP